MSTKSQHSTSKGVDSAAEQQQMKDDVHNETNTSKSDSKIEIESDDNEISHGELLLAPPPQGSQPLRRSSGTSKPPSEWWKSYVSTGKMPLPLLLNQVPLTYAQAIWCDDASFWKTGIDVERSAHERHGTWMLVPRCTAQNILTCRWIFNEKDLPTGGQKAKARLVARGFQQVQAVDYSDTCAPVVKLTSMRILLAIVAHFDLELHQMDVVTAFLNGDMVEDAYMQQPEVCKNV